MALVTATDALTAASTTSVASGATAQLIAPNTERNGLEVTVDPAGVGPVYLILGTGPASATVFHKALGPGGVWPGTIGGVVYRGAVQVFGTGARVAVAEA